MEDWAHSESLDLNVDVERVSEDLPDVTRSVSEVPPSLDYIIETHGESWIRPPVDKPPMCFSVRSLCGLGVSESLRSTIPGISEVFGQKAISNIWHSIEGQLKYFKYKIYID